MTYVYICSACRDGRHDDCEVNRDIPTDPEVCGGGHCVCSHEPRLLKSKFEKKVWERND